VKISNNGKTTRPTSSLSVYLEPETKKKWYYPVLASASKHYSKKLIRTRVPLADRVVLDHMASTEFPKVVLTKNSKAACTSIAHAMYFISTGRQYDGKIHRESDVLAQGRDHWDTLLARRARPDYKTFTFVRHPIDRLESAFKDFVIERRNPLQTLHAAGLKDFGCSETKGESSNLDAFLDYIEASFDASKIRTDRHWRPQVDNIGLGRFSYDFIGKVENLKDDMHTLFTMAGVDQEAINDVISIRENSSRARTRIANKRQQARIEMLYAADFDAFEYD
jgi:hypothetical protein